MHSAKLVVSSGDGGFGMCSRRLPQVHGTLIAVVVPLRSHSECWVPSVPSPETLGFGCVQNGSSAKRSEPDWR